MNDAINFIAAIFEQPNVLMALCCLGAAIGAIVYDVHLHMKVAGTRNWPSAQGTVIGADIVQQRQAYGELAGQGFTPGVFEAKIRYQFEVGGRTFVSDIIAPGGVVSTSNAARAEDWTARFPPGDDVTVYYNPSNPEDCCLLREKHGTGLMLLVAAMFLAFGVLAWFRIGWAD